MALKCALSSRDQRREIFLERALEQNVAPCDLQAPGTEMCWYDAHRQPGMAPQIKRNGVALALEAGNVFGP